ncbi:aspartate kinase [Flaviflexus salsibiostraticola]|uniref:Aspartokinase n=1 Tax=Flaviflexus salsibiostraticola TaxID=1282737 RepID=A0A3S8ZAL9_9ACTO|nr:aspartate kinase [Flaviflexus salsibiostraticola]AZN30512.1 aspartate kinase [Flaviflexus salsibiostraticola]
MSLIVQKYGGSSVSDADALKRVAARIVATKKAGNDLVVVVSAMGDTTDELLDLAAQVTDRPPAREMDILLTAGERVSMALLAMAVNDLGVPARAYTGQQAGLRTDNQYGKASIVGIVPERIARDVKEGAVAIIAGFQGVNELNDVTTLGRGGSDTTAVALAAAMHADVCEIYTDVDGLFSADPRIVPTARRVQNLDYEETLELAGQGAKILHLRAVEFARKYSVPLHVRSSYSELEGTWIMNTDERDMESPIITGIAHDRSQAKLSILGVPDVPGKAAKVFGRVAEVGANIDMIVQNIAASDPGKTDISFTLPHDSGPAALAAIEDMKDDLQYREVTYNEKVGKLSLIGAGMRSHPGVSAKLFGALADAGINIEMISTSEIRISVVVNIEELDKAVRAVHTAFDLDAEDTQAVVYGGTGR